MAQPQVIQREVDGGLGITPDAGVKYLCVVGAAQQGALDTPTPFAGSAIKLLKDTFGSRGAAVQFAARYMQATGLPVIFVRTGDGTDGYYNGAVAAANGTVGTITLTNAGAGTSTFANTTSNPTVTGSFQIVFLVGGTRGTAGIVYQVFKDGVSQGVASLGTATSLVLANGITIDMTAGTVVAGATVSFPTTAATPASAGSLVDSGGGSASVSLATIVAGTLEPNDDMQCWIQIVTGGTIGTDGIQLRWSRNGGRDVSELVNLGTANFYVIPDSGGVRVNFGAGTVTAGRTISWDAYGYQWNNSQLSSALTAAKNSLAQWELVHIIGVIDVTAFDIIESIVPDKKHAWIGNTRMPVYGETYANYVTAMAAISAAKSSLYGEFCSGDCECVSAIDGVSYRRPASWGLAIEEASSDIMIDIADPNRGAMKGITIRDSKGNPKYYDESYHGGLDALRFSVLRTWDPDIAVGVFPNRPRVFSPPGSDFYLMPHRRVLNRVHTIMRRYLAKRLNQPLEVNPKTGYLTPAERKSIETSARKALLSELRGAKIAVSDVTVTVSPNDNLLAGNPLTGTYRAVPLAYPEIADFEGGFSNPVTGQLVTA